MKKLIALTALFLAFGLSSTDATAKMKQADCVSLAIDVYDAYAGQGYTSGQAYQASNWAYEGCVSNGGNSGL